MRIQSEHGSFAKYLWQFVDFQPVVNEFATITEIPTQTEVSLAISEDLKKRGFSFVGPTIIYAYMQAIGMVIDHTSDCYLFSETIKKEHLEKVQSLL